MVKWLSKKNDLSHIKFSNIYDADPPEVDGTPELGRCPKRQ